MSRYAVVILGCLLLINVGCASGSEQEEELKTVMPTPTVHSVFGTANGENQISNDQIASDTLSGTPESQVVEPTLTPLPTLTPVPTIERKIVTIYGDDLNVNWTLENSREVEYSLNDDFFVYDGVSSLAYKPKVEYADLAFTVKEDANEFYLRDDVLAIRFWLYSNDDYVDTDDLLVSVVGSNDFRYWVDGDDSVKVQDSRPLFPATRLYYLNVEEDIPPNTWFQIEVWLNDLLFEPEYEYVTGVYIKNDEDFFQRIYIDEMELVLRVN